MSARIALANWAPDKFGLQNQGQITAQNVFASGTGYSPIKALAEISTALDGQTIGAFCAQDSTGTTQTFAGTADKLYQLSAGTFSDVSISGGYTIGGTERWEFAQFGQDVIAVSISSVPQVFTLGSSTKFANLAGSPPTARHIAIVKDFVVLGNDSATGPSNVTWSAINSDIGWTAGVNQSDSQLLPDGGWINGIVGGEIGYIFQERAITRMSYVGAPLYFQFDTVELNRGLASPGAIIKVGSQIFYRAQDGFFVKNGDDPSVSIGNQLVDNWFASNILSNTDYLVTCSADPINKLVYWSFVGNDATDPSHPNTVLIYNYSNQQWSFGKFDHEMLFPALTQGWTLEGIGNVYSSIESVPVSFDSRVWTGGTAILGAFDTSHKLCTFSGQNLAAIVTTADFEGLEGKRAMINNTRPLTDASAMTANCNYRERFADSVLATSSASMQSNGDIPLVASGRFFQIELSIPAGATWTYANGLDIDAQDDGDL